MQNHQTNQNALFDQVASDFASIEDLLKCQLHSSKLVENLINDLLDLAKMENGKFKLNEGQMDLIQCIHQSL